MLVFTAEEAWLHALPASDGSVHLRAFPDVPGRLARRRRWPSAGSGSADIRRVVTGALELERREKRIGASLQAAPDRLPGARTTGALLDGLDLAELAITSGIELRTEAAPAGAFTLTDVPGVAVVPALGRRARSAPLLAGPARGHGPRRASLPALRRRGRGASRPERAAACAGLAGLALGAGGAGGSTS